MRVNKFLIPTCEEVSDGANLYHWDLQVPFLHPAGQSDRVEDLADTDAGRNSSSFEVAGMSSGSASFSGVEGAIKDGMGGRAWAGAGTGALITGA